MSLQGFYLLDLQVTKRLYHPHVRDPKTGARGWQVELVYLESSFSGRKNWKEHFNIINRCGCPSKPSRHIGKYGDPHNLCDMMAGFKQIVHQDLY